MTKAETEKLEINSMNIAEEKRNEILRIFPDIRTEGGKVDFEKLKLILGEMVDFGKERYGMNWPGKTECLKSIQSPSLGTLLPLKNDSVKFEDTENIVVEGDNLEVLKLLQKSYLGKVKIIYIDPPYNTGKEFIYPDNFSESLDTYLKYTGQKDSQGRKFTTNTETDGRYHSKWMSMMYTRIFIAKNLLQEDGVFLASIDEKEAPNLRKICDEIFGEENFAGEIVWKNGSKNDQHYISMQHEYMICFVKNKNVNKGEWLERKDGLDEIYKAFDKFKKETNSNWDEVHRKAVEWYKQFPESNPISDSSHYSWMDENGVYFPDNISGPNVGQYVYEVKHPITNKPVKIPSRGWFCPESKMKEIIKEGRVHFGPDETTVPCQKTYLRNTEFRSLSSVLFKDGRAASKRLKTLFGENIFTNPKDEEVLCKIITAIGLNDGEIFLDFFAGSGTSAHALWLYNEAQKKKAKFILVQLPESLENMESSATGLSKKVIGNAIKYLSSKNRPIVISEILKERLRLAGEQFKNSSIDIGFKAYKLSESNFISWNQSMDSSAELERQLELHVDHVKTERTTDDILYEVLLKSGFPLSTKVEIQKVGERTVYSIASGMLLVCLEDNLTLDLVKHIAEQKPERVVCLDQGFSNNDQLKANAVQIFKTKGITKFQTV